MIGRILLGALICFRVGALLVSLHRNKLLELHEAQLLTTFGSNRAGIKVEKLDSGLWTLQQEGSKDQNVLAHDVTSHLCGMEAIYEEMTGLCRTPEELLKAVENLGLNYNDVGSFEVTLDCIYPFQRNELVYSGPQHLSHGRLVNPRMLLCAIAQRIQGMPALEDKAKDILSIVECGRGFVLAKKVKLSEEGTYSRNDWKSIKKKFKNRPFSFSAALSPDIAQVVIETLVSMHSKSEGLHLLDPCAGSGTTACVAMARYKDKFARVLSADVNPVFVKKAQTNVAYMGIADVSKQCQFVTQDATNRAISHDSTTDKIKFRADIVLVNLPWGEAAPESFFEDRLRIVQTLGSAEGTSHYSVNGEACAAFITNGRSTIAQDVYLQAGWQPEQIVRVEGGKQDIIVTLARLRRGEENMRHKTLCLQ